MKQRLLFITATVVVFGALLSSCELVKNLIDIEFDTGYSEISLTINPRDAGPIVFKEDYLKSELEQEIKDNGGDMSNLRNVKVNDVTLELVSGEPDLNALDYVDVYIGTPALGNTLIGSAKNIAVNQVSVDLVVSGTDLKTILSETEYLVLINGALDQPIKDTTNLILKIKYSVIVGP